MLKNYITTAIRNLAKNRIYTLINVSGLTVGIAAVMFILIYVNYETGYDVQFNNDNKVYRLIRNFNTSTGSRDVGITSGPYATALLNDFPGRIKETLRVTSSSSLITYDEKSFMEEKVFFADSNFFNFFKIPVIKGSTEKALLGNSILISSSMAAKYFGDTNPVNEILQIDNEYLFTITGVFDETRIQSHLQFDFLGSLYYAQNFKYFDDWWSNDFSTYLMLDEGAQIGEINAGLPAFTEKYFGDDWKRGVGNGLSLKTEALEDIYFNNETSFDFVLHGNKKVVYLFSGIAAIVLLIAAFNFVNLSTALSVSRYVEIGIRKASGASRNQIIIQFLMESILLVSCSTLLAFLALETLYPLFLSVVGKAITNPITIELGILLALFVSIVIGILSGLYPAIILSGFSTGKVLKGKPDSGHRGQVLRRGMVVLQFTFSIFLIFATWITWDQLKFVQSKNLGFSYEDRLFFPINNNEFQQKKEVFKQNVLKLPGVESLTFATGEPGGFHDFNVFNVEGQEGTVSMRTAFTDLDYLTTLDLNLIAGRNFSRDFPSDLTDAIILNEEALKTLDWTPEDAIGKKIENIFRDTIPRTVIGVVNNYHFRSLKEKINPLVISITSNHYVGIIKFKTKDLQKLVHDLTGEWNLYADGFPFAFNFLDDRIEQLYMDEKNQSQLFLIFCSLAIFIACMGLFALSILAAEKRMKEMAIRKVHGARVSQIVAKLNFEFIILVLISTVIMIPFGWYLMDKWLQNFEYHIEIGWIYFMGTALFVVILSLITVSYKAFRVAGLNPAIVLRYE